MEITDRIALGVFGSDEVTAAVDAHAGFIRGETLAVSLDTGVSVPDSEGASTFRLDVDLDGLEAIIALRREAVDG